MPLSSVPLPQVFPRPLLAQLRLGGRTRRFPMGEEDLQTLVRIWKEPVWLARRIFW